MALVPKKKNTQPKKGEKNYNSKIKTAKQISPCPSEDSQPLPSSFPCHLYLPTSPCQLCCPTPSTPSLLQYGVGKDGALSGFPFTIAFILIFLPYMADDFVSTWYLQN